MIPYGRQTIEDDDVEAVVEALRGDWLTQGPLVAELEDAFAAACSAPFAVAFSSGTAALHGAAFAAGLAPGDEFVTSAFTFVASANCGAYLGATPVFADIERSTWNISADTVRARTTARTKAVIPVHYAGLPAPVGALRRALGSDVRIIEDAAHALGADDVNGPIGSCPHSDMAVFSLHPVKAITSGEGGMVTTRDANLRDALLLFRNHGLTRDPSRFAGAERGGWYQEQIVLGFNYRLTDIQSALGLSQLAKLERFVVRRNEIASRYRAGFGDLEHLELPPEAPPGSRHAYHLFVVRHREGEPARARLYDELHRRQIRVQVHYPPVHLHPYYRKRFGYEPGLCPEAERVYSGCLSLPCFPSLTEADQDRVIAAVRELAG